MEHIGDLFAIESEARQRGLSLEARQTLRLKNANPLLDAIRKQIETARAMALPISALGKACTLHLREKAHSFLGTSGTGTEQQSGPPKEAAARAVSVIVGHHP